MTAARPLPAAELSESVAQVAARTDGWAGLRQARLLVTGGTGFFGRWLLETFVVANRVHGLGAHATVLTRSPAAFLAQSPHLQGLPELDFVQGDIRTFQLSGAVTHCIHGATAASALLTQAAPLDMFDTIASGTRQALSQSAAHGARRFLFLSSGAVYGPQPASVERVEETFLGGPDPFSLGAAYGEGKRAAEFLCAMRWPGGAAMDVVIARPFAFVGPHLPLDAHFAIGNFIRDALRGDAIAVNGDGTPLRSYLYATDLAAWLWTLLLVGQPGRAYNVGDEQAFSIEHIARLVASQTGATVTVAQPAKLLQMPTRYVPSTRRAQEELGLRAQVSLPEAIQRTLRWHGFRSSK